MISLVNLLILVKCCLELVLMSVFDGGLSSREIERRTRTDIFLICT